MSLRFTFAVWAAERRDAFGREFRSRCEFCGRGPEHLLRPCHAPAHRWIRR